jgi:hypothetical protein
MKQQNRFSSEQQQEQSAEQQAQQEKPLEFGSPEELIRFDAARTNVPERVAERVQRTVEKLPAPHSPWWKRLFGGSRS